jgi:hypothetical protein
MNHLPGRLSLPPHRRQLESPLGAFCGWERSFPSGLDSAAVIPDCRHELESGIPEPYALNISSTALAVSRARGATRFRWRATPYLEEPP